MAELRVNIGDSKSKKTYVKKLEDASSLVGKKIGDKIDGESVGLPSGYELQITGGSDQCGFPMRKDVTGEQRKKILIVGGVGLRNTKRKGKRVRKSVAGNTVHATTSQLNTKVVQWGKEPIEAPAPVEAEASAE